MLSSLQHSRVQRVADPMRSRLAAEPWIIDKLVAMGARNEDVEDDDPAKRRT